MTQRGLTIEQRFDLHWIPEPNSGCRLWVGSRNEFGYGVFRIDKGKNVRAHRFSYERSKGGIPEGFEIDHLCRNKSCVNPSHLEAVSPQENRRRENRDKVDSNTIKACHCAVCGAEIQRKYRPNSDTKCRKCIHLQASRKYERANTERKSLYYLQNRERLLKKAKDRYDKVKGSSKT